MPDLKEVLERVANDDSCQQRAVAMLSDLWQVQNGGCFITAKNALPEEVALFGQQQTIAPHLFMHVLWLQMLSNDICRNSMSEHQI